MSGHLNGNARLVGKTPALHPPAALAVIIERASEKSVAAVLNQLGRDVASYVVYLVPDAPETPQDPELRSTPAGLSAVYASNGQRLQRGQVTVLSQGVPWQIEAGHFITVADERESPLSSFLHSTAREYGANLVVAVLTELDGESSAGLRRVAESGGSILTVPDVQLPSSTDAPLFAQRVPRERIFSALASSLARLTPRADGQKRVLTAEVEASLDNVLETVRLKLGQDFREYKRAAVLRRVQRRIQATGLHDLGAYAEYLRNDPTEPELLLRELLTRHTQFFRDRDAFEYITTHLVPKLLSHKAPGSAVRLWVPSCATGEEAYSLALIFMDQLEQHELDLELQIFATDIDHQALSTARHGIYPTAIEARIPQSLLERYFVACGSRYQVSKRLRDCVIFSRHDLLKDPPFSRLDLISCRKVLPYLAPATQSRILPLLHYALSPGGYLILGVAEVPGACARLFSPLSKQHHVFQRRSIPGSAPPRAVSPLPRGDAHPAPARAPAPDVSLPVVVQRWLLGTYAPGCVVVDRNLDIVYFLGDTNRYLRPPAGTPTVNLLEVARVELRSALRACTQQAMTQGQTVVRDIGVDGGRPIRVVARPLAELGSDSFYLIIFEEEPATASKELTHYGPLTASDPAMKQIELELKRTQEQLQIIATEFQSSTEDLRASNEELLSMNEELQSSNEELETTKEELQSSNEELEAVNAELSSKLDELAQANSDVRNLLENTRIATLFLDHELRIMNYTPTAAALFALQSSDRGRPIGHIAQRFRYEHLQRDARQVIESLSPREAQVQSDEGSWFMMRILPYRSVAHVIEGVVVTLTDISELKNAELDVQRLSLAYERQLRWLEALIDVVPVGIAYHEKGTRGVRLNKAAVQALSLPAESLAGGAEPLGYEAWADRSADPAHVAFLSAVSADSPARDLEIELGTGESSRHLVLNSAPLADASASVYGQVSAFVDITEIRRARELAVTREQQQATIAELGLRALAPGNLATFLCDGLSLLCRAAGGDACDLMQLSDAKNVLVSSCRAGFSKPDAEVTEIIAPESPAAAALRRGDPIIFQRSEGHEGWPEYLDDEAVESGVRLAITSDNRQPFGLLGFYTRTRREFSKHDLHFLRAGALVLTSAIQRQLIDDARLRERELAAVRGSEEQLRRAERLASLGTFAAGIAHELNNPLNNISLAADYAQQSPDAERHHRLLSTIKSNAQRSGQIVESVLRFARDEVTERRALLPEPVIRRSVDLVRSEFKADRLSVKLKVEEQLPRICGNSTELEQVFVNLLRNAVEAHPGHCHVEIEAAVAGPYLRIVVSDDGPGIAASDLPHVFDPFFSTRRKQGGTGLGLSITHRIVAAHGGAIRVATDRALGTAFEIELPLAPEGCES